VGHPSATAQWGARRIAYKPRNEIATQAPSRSTFHRVLLQPPQETGYSRRCQIQSATTTSNT
jgi:hypothetical protein